MAELEEAAFELIDLIKLFISGSKLDKVDEARSCLKRLNERFEFDFELSFVVVVLLVGLSLEEVESSFELVRSEEICRFLAFVFLNSWFSLLVKTLVAVLSVSVRIFGTIFNCLIGSLLIWIWLDDDDDVVGVSCWSGCFSFGLINCCFLTRVVFTLVDDDEEEVASGDASEGSKITDFIWVVCDDDDDDESAVVRSIEEVDAFWVEAVELDVGKMSTLVVAADCITLDSERLLLLRSLK